MNKRVYNTFLDLIIYNLAYLESACQLLLSMQIFACLCDCCCYAFCCCRFLLFVDGVEQQPKAVSFALQPRHHRDECATHFGRQGRISQFGFTYLVAVKILIIHSVGRVHTAEPPFSLAVQPLAVCLCGAAVINCALFCCSCLSGIRLHAAVGGKAA